MSKYDADIIDAANDIQEDGVLATLSRTTGGTQDPGTGVTTGETTQTQSVYVVKLMPKGGAANESLDGVEANRAYLLCAALDPDGAVMTFYPDQGQQVTVASVVWFIEKAEPLEPDGVPILYKLAVYR